MRNLALVGARYVDRLQGQVNPCRGIGRLRLTQNRQKNPQRRQAAANPLAWAKVFLEQTATSGGGDRSLDQADGPNRGGGCQSQGPEPASRRSPGNPTPAGKLFSFIDGSWLGPFFGKGIHTYPNANTNTTFR